MLNDGDRVCIFVRHTDRPQALALAKNHLNSSFLLQLLHPKN